MKPEFFQSPSPVLLSSSCNVLASNSAIPDSGQLAYPFRRALLIDEIRWTMRIPSNALGAVNLGSLVSTKLAFGRQYLMRDPVPVWLLGTMLSGILQEEATDTSLDPDVVYSHYRWRLPEPLYLEPGEILGSWFNRGADGFGSIHVQVTYAGRTVAPNQPRPKVITVPYAASWGTTLGNAYQQSNENHLFNPFDRPLRIQRLTGRVLVLDAGTSAEAQKRLTPATAGSSVALRISDSWGGKMVNDNTGPADVFDIARSAWTVDTLMPPKGVYEVQAWNMLETEQVFIGMIGTREEQL